MPHPRVYADFQNLADVDRLKLTCVGTRRDLARLGLELEEGLALTLYTDDADDDGRSDDLLVDGVVRFHQGEQCWTAEVDWNSLRHASEQKQAEASAAKLPAAR
jgi:hypothetical protein